MQYPFEEKLDEKMGEGAQLILSRFSDVLYWVPHVLICYDIACPIFHLPGRQLWERL